MAVTRVACAQFAPEFGNRDKNVRTVAGLVEEAADHGAQLVVLPELASSGYMFRDRREAYSLAEEVPDGPACTLWQQVAAARNVYMVAGLPEACGASLYNAAVLIGPGGHLGTYRKMHLWNRENLFFEPGDLGFQVFRTEIGRISILICYDAWFPESFRISAVQGADIVCIPTNWVPIPGQDPAREAMATVLCMANAHANSVVVAAADRVQAERGQEFLGQSIIVGPTGWPAAGPASSTENQIIYADVDLGEARSGRNWNEFNQPLRDRRTDVYAETLGADVSRGWY
jgi:predicted amidohydrolase